MKYLVLALMSCFFLVGCAATEGTYYVDREHGMATNDAFDRQIVHKDYKYAGGTVEGLPALHAERIMSTYHDTFNKGFTKEDFDTTEIGSESSN